MMLILRSTHLRILAKGQVHARETIAKVNAERDGMRDSRDQWMGIAASRGRTIDALTAELAGLRAQLARQPVRQANGRFVSRTHQETI